MTNWRLQAVLRGLRNLRGMEHERAKRAYIDSLIDDQRAGMAFVEQQIEETKMIGVRNPAFDGDRVGYPDDDFDQDSPPC